MKPIRTLLLVVVCLLLAWGGAIEPAQLGSPPAVVPTAGANPFRSITITPHYDHSLGFYDMIAPVYEPEFLPAAEARLEGEQLVIGVAWGGEARAYPICVLRFREMVNDELAGVPILVSW